MKKEEYRDISPYYDEDLYAAIARLKDNKSFFKSASEMVFTDHFNLVSTVKRKNLQHKLNEALDTVHTVEDFQQNVTSAIMIRAVIKNSMAGFTYEGLENLEKGKAYFFFSNHRDIVLDCALLNDVLGRENYGYTEIAIGDNLLVSQLSLDLFKLNGGVTVKRSLPLREKFAESKRLSSYFYETIAEANKSMWVAQKSGRAKDGIDLTNPAIIKMLYLSQKDSGMRFKELLETCPIVPVAISYEYDPCDINKGREELSKRMKGFYNKKKYEDMINVLRGIRKYKGHVHLHVGKPISTDLPDHKAVAEEIDRQIHLGYRLWGTNYIAFDEVTGSNRFADEYTQEEKENFAHRYRDLSENLREFVYQAYANPVIMKLKAQGLWDGE
ncbi:MAG: 1-acyl-sn-glycerol-3-phosphate acyltransferase [Spirochaetota bacterium]